MTWKNIKIDAGSKLFKVHNFTYVRGGSIYILEVDEYSDGSFSGHGEHSTDRSNVIESVSGSSLEDCLEQLVAKVNSRG